MTGIGLFTHNHSPLQYAPRRVTVQGPSPAALYAAAVAADALVAKATAHHRRQWWVDPSRGGHAVLASQDPPSGAWTPEHRGFGCRCGTDHSLDAGAVLASWREAHKSATQARWELPGAPPFTPKGITLVPPYEVPTAALAEATAAAAGEKLRVRLPSLSYFSREGAGKAVDGLSLDVPRFLGIAADLTPERTVWAVAHEAGHLALFAREMRQDEVFPDAFADRWVSEHSR